MRKYLTLIIVLLVTSGSAIGHAFLDHADPKVGAEVRNAPSEIKVWFTEEIEPQFSSLQVFNASGSQIDNRDAHVDAKDPKLLIVSVPKLEAGEFKVVWSVVASDTHRTHGDFKFTVKKD